MNKYFCVFALIAGVALASCANKQYQVLFQKRATLAGDTARSFNAADSVREYRIQAQDVLQIRNLQDIKYIANLSPVSANTAGGNASQGESFQVEPNGSVKLPALGPVQVAGLTRLEAQDKIEKLYGNDVLVKPIIDLKITTLKVTVLGEIKGQGNYPLTKDRTTLVELIGQAGGLTDRANEKNIKIIRGNSRNPTVIEIDLDDIGAINDPKAVLQNGDIIYVAQNRRAVRSDNLQNVSTIVQPLILFFNTALIIFTLAKK